MGGSEAPVGNFPGRWSIFSRFACKYSGNARETLRLRSFEVVDRHLLKAQMKPEVIMPNDCTPLAVLVIEDERLIRWALTEALTEGGHTVVEAPDGSNGLRAVMTAPQAFDVIFLDFRLPDSNDFALLTAIRTQAPRSAVVLMTASGTPELLAEAYRLGVSRVLNKPFDLVEVYNMLAALSPASRTPGGDFHGSPRHQRVPVSVSVDRGRYGHAAGTVDLRDLPALP